MSKKMIVLSLLSALLLGCSYYHEQQQAYSKATNGPGLVTESPLTNQKMSTAYVIPEKEKTPASINAPVPPGSSLDK